MRARPGLAAILLLGGWARPLAAGPPVEVDAPHFVVYSDAGEKDARRIGERFEQIRAAFGVFWPWARVDPGAPLVILARRNAEGFAELRLGSGRGGRTAFAGFFSPGLARYFIGLRADVVEGRDDEALSLLFHEYAHLVLDLNFERLPLWMNEGLAELFGGSAVRSGYVEVGRPIVPHLGRLRVGTLLPLARLFAIDRRSPEYSEARRINLFYAQSWALMHYFMIDQREARPEAVGTLLRHLTAGMDADAALRAAGFDPAQVEKELASYVRRPSLSAIRALNEEVPSGSSLPSRALSPAEWKAARALFLAHLGHTEAALELVGPALEAAPGLALGHEARALAFLRRDHPEQAVGPAEEAVRLDPDSLPARYVAALVSLGAGSTPAAERALRHLRRAVELGPDYAPAHEKLAQVLLGRPADLDEALVLARRAAVLEPSSSSHRVVLAFVLTRAERFEEARGEAESAVRLARTPDERSRALELLERVAAAVPADVDESGCASGDARACVELGTRYYSGTGVEPSQERALELFRRGCAAGLTAGCTQEGLVHAAAGTAEGDRRAATLLAETCERGDARACGALGALVEMGRGGAGEIARAIELHRRACEGGYEASCVRVSTLEGDAGGRAFEGWGELVDPSGAATVRAEGDRLLIDVPGGPHDLSAEIGEMTAPRLLRPVEGDFAAEVTVLSPLEPGKKTAIPGTRLPYNGAGLLVWIDGGNYVRLEAAALRGGGAMQVYTLFELRHRGRSKDYARWTGRGQRPPLSLRIERRASGLVALARRPGKNWRRVGEIKGTFPRRMQVGVAAVSTSRSPLHVELEGFRVAPIDAAEALSSDSN